MAPTTRTGRGMTQDGENLPQNDQDHEGRNARVSEAEELQDVGDPDDMEIVDQEESAQSQQADQEDQGTLSLADQLKKEQARQKGLLQVKESRLIKEKIERLRAENDQMEEAEVRSQSGPSAAGPSAGPSSNAPIEHPQGHKREVSSTAFYPYSKKKPIRAPTAYCGRNDKEWVDFIDTCEMSFLQDEAAFRDEKDRVFWASQYLDKEPRDRWRLWRHDHKHELVSVTWDFFKKFLHDLLDDPYNRTVKTYEKYEALAHRPGQTPRQFLTAMETVEQQMPHGSFEDHLKWTYFARLQPELRRAITNHNVVPNTREELANLATTLANNLEEARNTDKDTARGAGWKDRRGGSSRGGFGSARGDRRGDQSDRSGRDSGPDKDDQDQKRPDRQRGGFNRRGGRGGGPGGSSDVICYRCDKPGHIATKCPEKQTDNLAATKDGKQGKA